MFNISKKLLIALAFISTLSANNELSQKQINEIQNLELFKKAQVNIQKAYDMDSLYLLNVIVQGKYDSIYLTKDKKYLIAGSVINTNDGKTLSVPVDLSELKNKEALTYGTGKDRYYLFTDPQCPYCKQFESHFPKIKDKVDIKVFYFPLDFHKEARDLSMYVMSQKTNDLKEKAMLSANKDDKGFLAATYSKEEKEALNKHLEVQLKIAAKLKVRGTPAIFDKDGNSVVWVELLEKYGVSPR